MDDQTVEILRKLVALGKDADGNIKVAEYIETLFKAVGLEVTLDRSADGKNANLIARIGPAVAGGIGLSTHTDAVPVEDAERVLWKTDPYVLRLEEGVLYGRGTLDNNAATAAFLAELPRLAELAERDELKEPLYILLTYGEEPNKNGIRSTGQGWNGNGYDGDSSWAVQALNKMDASPRLIIVAMPTDNQVVSAQPTQVVGCKITSRASGGFSFDGASGNAHDVATGAHFKIIVSRETLAEQDILVVNKLDDGHDGGSVTVPGEVVSKFDVRVTPGVTGERVVNVLAGILKGDLGDVTTTVTGINPGFIASAESVALGLRLANKPNAIKVPYATEAAHLDMRRDGSVIVCGPGKISGDSSLGIGRAHGSNEGITLASLEGFSNTLLANVTRFCTNTLG